MSTVIQPTIRVSFWQAPEPRVWLTAAIGRFIDTYNERCEPFAWTKGADELLAKVRPSGN